MGALADWQTEKKKFEKATGKHKPKTKIFGVSVKATGLSKSLSLFEKAGGYKTKNVAVHLFVAQATAYMKALKAEADACDKKDDADYLKALKAMADGIEAISNRIVVETKETVATLDQLVKAGKLKSVRKFCEGEFNTENLDFLEAIQKVKKVTDLRALLDDYIAKGGSKEVNLDSATRKIYLEAIRGEYDLKKALEKLEHKARVNMADILIRYSATLKVPKVKSAL
ncbi:regulator of G-protein signaling domain-containing protein [Azospirillum canadense]|uniref:regulator of G-protein signaling domain-containing protein n=1 Tax=Azospirillum canadense TaxID=403962 RepID=UPI0022272551|nr:regulator of G-protein signaling domain-containing protein [Azospirillum canadense]MCW2236489.1 hypothetical protein [Azospirillum canadense]